MSHSTEPFSDLLAAFTDQVELIWQQYEQRGPGAVDAALFQPIDELARQLALRLKGPLPEMADSATLDHAMAQAVDLSRRCATLSQGLCFVSGEAGLVPRRDQIDAFATARKTLRDHVERLANG